MTISLEFHGAAGTVTGSRHLISVNKTHVLVDCGMFQGLKALRQLNWQRTQFDPRTVSAVLLTHAHVDHSGYLPRLVKDGFRGHIYATPATCDLAEVLLLDAARLQQEDADYANRKRFSKHHPALPLFDEDDARAALKLFRPVPFDHELKLPGVTATFRNAGHILGSAHIEARLDDGQATTTIVFSGDVGRYHVPLHSDPSPLPECDAVVLESTYGDRHHDERPLADQLRDAVRPTLEGGGTVLIPAFAVARAQLLILLLGQLMAAGRIPRVPIDLDSPMAVDATNIYERYATSLSLDEGVRRGLHPEGLRLHRSVPESRALNDAPGPRVIVSSSGMLTGGRVLHHLARLAGSARNLIVLAGYQAVGTRGRALEEGARTLRIHGQDVPIHAQTKVLQGFSAHADRGELVHWLESAPRRPDTVFLVHGEAASTADLAKFLTGQGYNTLAPAMAQKYTFVPQSRRWQSSKP